MVYGTGTYIHAWYSCRKKRYDFRRYTGWKSPQSFARRYGAGAPIAKKYENDKIERRVRLPAPAPHRRAKKQITGHTTIWPY